ncbi:MAG: class I SAM-dependent methyltransferase family protein [Candidatus Methanoperedens sp.]|nr:class I SAM-dependent methyltransferase family protein [Candidatus Methanoperedens sp.]
MKESLCIRVHRSEGESIRKKLVDLCVLNMDLKIRSIGEYLLIPVTARLEEIGELTIDIFEVLEYERPLAQAPGAYELIGDIAIIDQHEVNVEDIAKILLQHKNIKTVLQAKSAVSGEYRTRELEFIAGEKKNETVYRENGCRYLLDVSKVYFTPRLSTERMRIAEQVKDGEKIVDMFAGIGPFSILIAKRSPGAQVISIDKNPVAIKYLRENAKLNKLGNIEIKEGDAHEEVSGISDADHIIMNLPHSAIEFIDAALGIINNGGIIHFYAISHEDDLFEGIFKVIEEHAARTGFRVISLDKRIVRPYAPYQYNVCIEFRVVSRQG